MTLLCTKITHYIERHQDAKEYAVADIKEAFNNFSIILTLDLYQADQHSKAQMNKFRCLQPKAKRVITLGGIF